MPQYMLLLRDAGSFPADLSPEEIQAIIQRYIGWRNKVAAGGRRITGHKLKDREGRLLRGGAGSPVATDGPYAEAKEVIGGLFAIKADDYEKAVEIARECPHLKYGGRIELREIEPTP
jgi:hypothetical protein